MPKAVSFFLAWSLIIAAAKWTHIANVISILFSPGNTSVTPGNSVSNT